MSLKHVLMPDLHLALLCCECAYVDVNCRFQRLVPVLSQFIGHKKIWNPYFAMNNTKIKRKSCAQFWFIAKFKKSEIEQINGARSIYPTTCISWLIITAVADQKKHDYRFLKTCRMHGSTFFNGIRFRHLTSKTVHTWPTWSNFGCPWSGFM